MPLLFSQFVFPFIDFLSHSEALRLAFFMLSFPCVPFWCSAFLPRSVRFSPYLLPAEKFMEAPRVPQVGAHNRLRGRPPHACQRSKAKKIAQNSEREANGRHTSGGDLLNARTPAPSGGSLGGVRKIFSTCK